MFTLSQSKRLSLSMFFHHCCFLFSWLEVLDSRQSQLEMVWTKVWEGVVGQSKKRADTFYGKHFHLFHAVFKGINLLLTKNHPPMNTLIS